MQALWSRVAQVRATCSCPQCLNAANGVTRRATASATRRMPRYLYSSTLWYSGIFAAAATFDASRKERRKEQWDRVIAEVRQELEQPSKLEVRNEAKDSLEENALLNVDEDDAIGYRPFGGLVDGPEVQDRTFDGVGVPTPQGGLDGDEDIFDLVDPLRPRPQYPTNTGLELHEHHMAPQSIYATEWAKQGAEPLRWTPKKLATVQKCAELLQLQIIASLQRNGIEEEAAAEVPEEYAQYIRQPPSSLQTELKTKFAELHEIKRSNAELSDYHARQPSQSTKLCHYSQDPHGHFHDTTREANRSLRTLFRQRIRDEISQAALLAKVAYTLYISPAPPNLGTFNTLLIGFRHVKAPDLVRRTIINMHESHMRANEVTLAASLEHYTQRDDIMNFVKSIERIRGKHGGTMLARPDVRIATDAAKKRLIRVEFDGRNGREVKVIQLPTPTPIVFDAIVKGVLKFAGFEAALSICEGMGKDGWGLCMAGLTPLLNECADRGDWASGLAVWRQIQALKVKSDSRQLGSEYTSISAFAAMLRLCTKCDQKDAFDNVWRQVSKLGTHPIVRVMGLLKSQVADRKTPLVEERGVQDSGSEPSTQFRIDTESEVAAHNVNREYVQQDSARGTSDNQNHSMEPSIGATSDAGRAAIDKHDTDRRYWQEYGSNPIDDELDVAREKLIDETSSFAVRRQPDDEPKRPSQAPLDDSTALLEQQLLGLHPPSHELDDYELRERPMSATG